MHSFLRRTARLFCFSRKQQRGLLVLSSLLWLTVVARVWYHYHPVAHALPDAAYTAMQDGWSGDEGSVIDSTMQHTNDLEEDAAADSTGPGKGGTDSGTGSGSSETAAKRNVTGWRAVQQKRMKGAGAEHVRIELNRADTAQLMSLRGIGRTFSRRMVSYRNLLGGYVSTEQLKEVYGLRPGLVDTLSVRLTVDTLAVRKMILPGTAYRDLLRHPYLEKADVDNIMAYLEINGGISTVQELLENRVLDRETYLRIRPYLTIGATTADDTASMRK